MKVQSNYQLIKWIDRKYGILINSIAKKVKYKYPNIPLDASDLVNEFMICSPELIRRYDPDKTTSKFHTFVGYQAFYQMSNVSRKYISKNHNIMNNSKSLNEMESRTVCENSLYDSSENKKPKRLYISKLSNLEKKVFKKYFIEELSIKETANVLLMKESKIINTIARARKKLKYWAEK